MPLAQSTPVSSPKIHLDLESDSYPDTSAPLPPPSPLPNFNRALNQQAARGPTTDSPEFPRSEFPLEDTEQSRADTIFDSIERGIKRSIPKEKACAGNISNPVPMQNLKAENSSQESARPKSTHDSQKTSSPSWNFAPTTQPTYNCKTYTPDSRDNQKALPREWNFPFTVTSGVISASIGRSDTSATSPTSILRPKRIDSVRAKYSTPSPALEPMLVQSSEELDLSEPPSMQSLKPPIPKTVVSEHMGHFSETEPQSDESTLPFRSKPAITPNHRGKRPGFQTPLWPPVDLPQYSKEFPRSNKLPAEGNFSPVPVLNFNTPQPKMPASRLAKLPHHQDSEPENNSVHLTSTNRGVLLKESAKYFWTESLRNGRAIFTFSRHRLL